MFSSALKSMIDLISGLKINIETNSQNTLNLSHTVMILLPELLNQVCFLIKAFPKMSENWWKSISTGAGDLCRSMEVYGHISMCNMSLKLL